MKKLFLILTGLLLSLALIACGEKPAEEAQQEAPAVETEQVQEAATEAVTEAEAPATEEEATEETEEAAETE